MSNLSERIDLVATETAAREARERAERRLLEGLTDWCIDRSSLDLAADRLETAARAVLDLNPGGTTEAIEVRVLVDAARILRAEHLRRSLVVADDESRAILAERIGDR